MFFSKLKQRTSDFFLNSTIEDDTNELLWRNIEFDCDLLYFTWLMFSITCRKSCIIPNLTIVIKIIK